MKVSSGASVAPKRLHHNWQHHHDSSKCVSRLVGRCTKRTSALSASMRSPLKVLEEYWGYSSFRCAVCPSRVSTTERSGAGAQAVVWHHSSALTSAGTLRLLSSAMLWPAMIRWSSWPLAVERASATRSRPWYQVQPSLGIPTVQQRVHYELHSMQSFSLSKQAAHWIIRRTGFNKHPPSLDTVRTKCCLQR